MNIVKKKQAYKIPIFTYFLVECGQRYKGNNVEKRVLQYFCEALYSITNDSIQAFYKIGPVITL